MKIIFRGRSRRCGNTRHYLPEGDDFLKQNRKPPRIHELEPQAIRRGLGAMGLDGRFGRQTDAAMNASVIYSLEYASVPIMKGPFVNKEERTRPYREK
jgi:hypothetical protein